MADEENLYKYSVTGLSLDGRQAYSTAQEIHATEPDRLGQGFHGLLIKKCMAFLPLGSTDADLHSHGI